MNNSWFNIEAKAEKKSADVYIFDYIGGWDISARGFVEQVKDLDVEQINLHINSPGGAVFDGIAIHNVIKHHKSNVTVYIDGLAASIASVIALAGDDIRIADNAYVMIHNPVSIVYGEAKDMIKEAELLEKVSNGVAGDYAKKMGITVEAARELMDQETWYLGQEAVDAGFADVSFEGSKAAAYFDLGRVSNNAPDAAIKRFAQASQNKNKKENAMRKSKADNPEPKGADIDAKVPDVEGDDANEPTRQEEQEHDPGDVDAAVQAALKKERKRIAAINDIGAKFGFQDSAKAFVADGKSVEDFRAHILDKSPDDWRASLAIKNPSQQASEQELNDTAQGDDIVAKLKARRHGKHGNNNLKKE